VTVSEQRDSEPASKKSEPAEKKAQASTKSSVAEATEASNEDISRLQLEVQELVSWAERFLLSQTGIPTARRQ
jgi:hypothetical protein